MSWYVSTTLLLCAFAAMAPAASAQDVPAKDLVRQVIENELKMQDQDHTDWMYREASKKDGVPEVAEVVQTKQGELHRVIERNGKPLSEEDQKTEDDRMDHFARDAGEQRKKQKASGEDSRKTRELMQMLPDAFLYSYAGDDGDLKKLSFRPNPEFQPKNMEAKVFHAMEGVLTVNAKEKRIAGISGRLMQDVWFGGFLGHLNQGGTFDVRQEEVAPDLWQITKLKVNMKGRALFFKTIDVHQDEVHSDFHQVPQDLTMIQAEEMIRKPTIASK